MSKIIKKPVKIANTSFEQSVDAEYFAAGSTVAKRLMPVAAAIAAGRDDISAAVMKSTRAVALVLAAMEKAGVGMRQKDLAAVLHVHQSTISRTGSWYSQATKDGAHVITGKELGLAGSAARKTWPVVDWGTFVRLLDAGATRQLLDLHFAREPRNSGFAAPKTPQQKAAAALARYAKEARESGQDVPEIPKAAFEAVADNVFQGNFGSDRNHAVQAEVSEDPRDKADVFISLGEEMLAALQSDEGQVPGYWRREQLGRMLTIASDVGDAVSDLLATHQAEREMEAEQAEEAEAVA